MRRAIRLLAGIALLAAGGDAAVAGPLFRLPFDITPADRPAVRQLPPLPRLRPHVRPRLAAQAPDLVSPEITGSISDAPAPASADAPRPAAPPPAASAPAAPVPKPSPLAVVAAPAKPVTTAATPAPVATPAVAVASPPVEPLDADDPGASVGFTDRKLPVAAAPKADRLPELAAPPPPPAPLGEPYMLVRTLQSLQDEIAQGSTDALLAQRDLRARMDVAFQAFPAATWQDERNAAAAVTYVLSGGAPAILARMKTLASPPAIDANLLDGALAYVEGDETAAGQLLGGLNAFDLLPSMGGQVALAQSALAVRTDPARALRLLDIARLLAPGTLVEEAAIRREIFVADQTGDGARVIALSRQYLERFRHSVYAGNFRTRFAAALSHMDLTSQPEQSQAIDDMLSAVEPAGRCQLFLTLALASVTKGNAAAAALAADRAAALALPGSNEDARAHLYRAAGRLADVKAIDGAAADLKAVRRDILISSDQALYDDVAATIAGVVGGTDVPANTPVALDASDTELTPLFDRAGAALKTADTLLAAVAK